MTEDEKAAAVLEMLAPCRVFVYVEQTDKFGAWRYASVSEREILTTYWPYWAQRMRDMGRADLISHENCIADFVTVHWAWELK